MIKWLARFFRPKTIYLVYNEEPHVGSFFQEAFYDRELAEDCIRVLKQHDLNQRAELEELMQEEVAAGRYPAELYEPADLTQSTLKLTIEEYEISVDAWIEQRKKMLQPSVK